MKCKACGAEIADNSDYCAYCGVAVTNVKETVTVETVEHVRSGPKLKWHYFLCVMLWIEGALNMAYGARTLMHVPLNEYGAETAAQEKAVLIIYGIALILCALLAFLTAYMLLKFKRGAPKLLYALYAFAGTVSLFVLLFVDPLEPGYIAYGQTGAGIAALLAITITMLLVNIVYSNKRKELFVN